MEDAEFVLLAAEHDSFPIEMSPDPIFDTNMIQILERLDNQAIANLRLSRALVSSSKPDTLAAVNRILAANPPETP